mgnify:FL=1|tara:strand:- start:264 stop:758 length:495 start_codon:yes stop_codon:yes gene_type:complete
MNEYIHKDGTIKNQSQIKDDNPNISFSSGAISEGTLSDLGYSGVLATTPPTPSSSTKVIVRDGVEKDSNGNWAQKWKEVNRFSSIKGGKTKKQQDDEYQASLDEVAKNVLRQQRKPLLEEADWNINKLEDAGSDTKTWRAYRQELREITDASDVYNVTWPTKPS